mmetsp:Transcript_37466/g.105798  ORF Transcript_37466/g.105798 Transcript_37466/m.105798 type:complete len:220 (-) Transcript_37466:905-1564(-)
MEMRARGDSFWAGGASATAPIARAGCLSARTAATALSAVREAAAAAERAAKLADTRADEVEEIPLEAAVVAKRPMVLTRLAAPCIPLPTREPTVRTPLTGGLSRRSVATEAAAARVALPAGCAIRRLAVRRAGTTAVKAEERTIGWMPRRPRTTAAAVRVAWPTERMVGQLFTSVSCCANLVSWSFQASCPCLEIIRLYSVRAPEAEGTPVVKRTRLFT